MRIRCAAVESLNFHASIQDVLKLTAVRVTRIYTTERRISVNSPHLDHNSDANIRGAARLSQDLEV
jgi:hypothetical protein